ncbi:MAG: hypothetical protein F6J93_00600 [Oscillatoria sp. SIO1A7]|nr:hypothetical protein [Oscillatoria sp. SIO1A7]
MLRSPAGKVGGNVAAGKLLPVAAIEAGLPLTALMGLAWVCRGALV